MQLSNVGLPPLARSDGTASLPSSSGQVMGRSRAGTRERANHPPDPPDSPPTHPTLPPPHSKKKSSAFALSFEVADKVWRRLVKCCCKRFGVCQPSGWGRGERHVLLLSVDGGRGEACSCCSQWMGEGGRLVLLLSVVAGVEGGGLSCCIVSGCLGEGGRLVLL